MISQGASEINISFVVEDSDVGEAVRRLHRCFFEAGWVGEPMEAGDVPRAQPLASQVAAQPEVG
jgi:hypothetical protein